jgi:hypothetical protein
MVAKVAFARADERRQPSHQTDADGGEKQEHSVDSHD